MSQLLFVNETTPGVRSYYVCVPSALDGLQLFYETSPALSVYRSFIQQFYHDYVLPTFRKDIPSSLFSNFTAFEDYEDREVGLFPLLLSLAGPSCSPSVVSFHITPAVYSMRLLSQEVVSVALPIPSSSSISVQVDSLHWVDGSEEVSMSG